MKNIAHQTICLKLNRSFVPVAVAPVGKTISDIITGAVKAIDVVYATNEDGTTNFDKVEYINTCDWNEWMTLPVLEHHQAIHSQHMTIRIPSVVVASNYYKVHYKKFQGKPTKEGLFIRDGGKDGITGEDIAFEDATIEHVIALSCGGTDTYDNTILTTKELNNLKGSKSLEEMGWTLKIDPKHPKPIPSSMLIRKSKVIDWKHFLITH